MASKAERTRQYILETVSPVFNKQGYAGTSLKDLTDATGLTKGAIYGNFKDKEQLAIEAFNFNIKKMLEHLNAKVMQAPTPIQQLYAITDYYRGYYQKHIQRWGGCPILNVSVDANHLNSALFRRAQLIIRRLQSNMVKIVQAGIQAGEIKATVDAKKIGPRIYAQIQGGIFTMVMLESPQILDDILDQIDLMIATEMEH